MYLVFVLGLTVRVRVRVNKHFSASEKSRVSMFLIGSRVDDVKQLLAGIDS